MNNCDCNSTGGCPKCKPQKGVIIMKPNMKIKELRKVLLDLVIVPDMGGLRDGKIRLTEKSVNQLLNLFTKTMGEERKEEREIIMGDIRDLKAQLGEYRCGQHFRLHQAFNGLLNHLKRNEE